MSLIFDLANNSKIEISATSTSNNTVTDLNNITQNKLANNSTNNNINNNGSLILQAPQLNQVLFFNEPGLNVNTLFQNNLQNTTPTVIKTNNTFNSSSSSNIAPQPPPPAGIKHSKSLLLNSQNKQANRTKKKVTFPEDDKIIKDYSDPPKRGWMPGLHSTSDLLQAYLKSCDRHKCKPLAKLMPQLKALQDLDCVNGEKVNVLNLKSEKLDSRQMEALEEIFKRLSFKTIDLESSQLEDDSTGATLFEILDYYDTCERLILANSKTIHYMGWQSLAKYIRKTTSLDTLDLRGHYFSEFIHFTYLARSFRLTVSLRIVHLENSNIQGRFLLMLAAALKDNEVIKEIYLGDNKMQPTDGQSICTIIKENKCLELLDLKNNNLQDIGLSHICSGLSEKGNSKFGLKSLSISNNNITANGISYLSKALIHNRSLTSINLGQNSLTNEAVYELKEALIVNKQISSLILTKVKLTDEGVIALAEYIAETQSLRRLDVRENDIRLGGLMALASSLKFNKTLDRLDLDREPKREYSIKDSIETSKRLIQDINEFCMRNKREQNERESQLVELNRLKEEERKRNELENEKKLVELLNELNTQLESENANKEDEDVNPSEIESNKLGFEDNDGFDEIKFNDDKEESNDLNENGDENLDLIENDDELLKKILNRTFNSAPNILSPIKPNKNDLFNYLNLVEESQKKIDPTDDEFQFIGTDLNVTPIKEVDLDMVVFRSTPANSNKPKVVKRISFDLGEEEEEQDEELLNDKNKSFSDDDKNEVLAIANNLVDTIVNKFNQDEELKTNQNSEIEIRSNPVQSLTRSDSSDLNDVSFSIEKEPANPIVAESRDDSLIESNNVNASACMTPTNNTLDEDDSDIEVLTVSSKTNSIKNITDSIKKQQNKNIALLTVGSELVNGLSENKINGYSNALLNSISENEVECLVNGVDSNQKKLKFINDAIREEIIDSSEQSEANINKIINSNVDDTDSCALISNYDLLADDSPLNSFVKTKPDKADSEDLNKIEAKSKVNSKMLVNYSINTTQDSASIVTMNNTDSTSIDQINHVSTDKQSEAITNHSVSQLNCLNPNANSIISSSDNSIILASSPVNECESKFPDFEISSPTNIQEFKQIDLNSSFIKNNAESELIEKQTTDTNKINAESSHEIVKNGETETNLDNFDSNANNSSNKPFFASKLTNSQLSEELSQEIGL